MAAFAFVPAAALAQGDAGALELPPGKAKHRHRRLDSILNRVVVAYDRHLNAALKKGAMTPLAARLAAQDAAGRAAATAPMHRGGSVAVTFRIDDASKIGPLTAFLKANGGDARNVGDDYVEAYVPAALLIGASKRPGVARVQAILPPQPKRGPVTSQGVTVHGAPLWHALGFTGEGVKVGVIDPGFSGLRRLLGSELPATVAARCYADVGRPTSRLTACDNEGEVHGTAVAEALLDIAPDVSLYIADPQTRGDMASAVEWMAVQGVQVINYSVGHLWDGPGDGTSPHSESPLNAVDAAIERGIVWVNAAGNEGRSAWFGGFQDANGDGFHEFSYDLSQPELNCFTGSGDEAWVQLRWQGAWLSKDRLADLDLYLYDWEGLPVAFSEDFQSDTRQPTEVLAHQANSGETFCIAVHHDRTNRAPAPDWIQLVMVTSETLSHYTLGASIGNPAESANPGLLAVGAASWHRPRTIEEYSSLGPAPDGRIKPDIVGVDRADSASYPDGFHGTSQASPHVAGLAALVLDAWPSYTPREVTSYLKRNADRRTYHPLLGWLGHPNNIWGHGLAGLPPIAVRYRQQIANDGPVTLPLTRYFPTADARTTFTASSSNPDLIAVAVRRDTLVIVPAQDGEGQATITITAWFRSGLRATVTIVANVERASMPARALAGWRLALYQGVSSTTPGRGAFVR